MGYGELRSKISFYCMALYFHFENPNNRSEPLNMFSILKCAWKPILHFLECFYYLLSHFENCRSTVNSKKSKNFWTIGSAIFKVG